MSPIFCDSNYSAGGGKMVSVIPFWANNWSFLQMVLLLQYLQHLNQLRLMFNAAAPKFCWATVKLVSEIILLKLYTVCLKKYEHPFLWYRDAINFLLPDSLIKLWTKSAVHYPLLQTFIKQFLSVLLFWHYVSYLYASQHTSHHKAKAAWPSIISTWFSNWVSELCNLPSSQTLSM